jgi:hypothetical protein
VSGGHIARLHFESVRILEFYPLIIDDEIKWSKGDIFVRFPPRWVGERRRECSELTALGASRSAHLR